MIGRFSRVWYPSSMNGSEAIAESIRQGREALQAEILEFLQEAKEAIRTIESGDLAIRQGFGIREIDRTRKPSNGQASEA